MELAQLIFSLAQYEGYNTSLIQTRKNLSSRPESREFTTKNDQVIFDDLLKAITYAATQTSLDIDVFKRINASMDSKQEGQPEHPGVLRKGVPIVVGNYVPYDTVTEERVSRMIASVKTNDRVGGWQMYAKLAKLQAFDNGNKRTALISANLFIGALANEEISPLLIPVDYQKLRFDANLFDYYLADDWDDHYMDEADALKQFTDFALTSETRAINNKFELRLNEAEEETKKIKPDTQNKKSKQL